MDWYYVDITEDRVEDGEYHRLCRQFQQAFIAAGAPPEMALFAQMALRDNIRKVYFSPGSVHYVKQLIDTYGGNPCDGPERSKVTLVFGVPDAGWALLGAAEVENGDGASERYPVLYPVAEQRTSLRMNQTAAVVP